MASAVDGAPRDRRQRGGLSGSNRKNYEFEHVVIAGVLLCGASCGRVPR